jgi:hypothetical protein
MVARVTNFDSVDLPSNLPGWPPLVIGSATDVQSPYCASENVHLGPVTVVSGEAAVRVTGNCEVEVIPWGEQRRGATVTLAMFCEAGHRWTTALSFLKGTTAVVCQALDPFRPGDEPEELWRD